MSSLFCRSVVRIPALAAALLLGACAAPSVLKGDFATITPQQAALSQSVAVSPVRWGGTILSSSNTPEQSCFEILSRPLDYNARPLATDSEQGRFLACKAGFIDPALFKPGRDVTIIGAVTGVEERKVDDFNYRYPKLQAQTLYLWPERTAETYYAEPFFYPYPYYFYYPHHYHYYRESPRPGVGAPIPPDTGVSPPRRSEAPVRPRANFDDSVAPAVSRPVGKLLGQ